MGATLETENKPTTAGNAPLPGTSEELKRTQTALGNAEAVEGIKAARFSKDPLFKIGTDYDSLGGIEKSLEADKAVILQRALNEACAKLGMKDANGNPVHVKVDGNIRPNRDTHKALVAFIGVENDRRSAGHDMPGNTVSVEVGPRVLASLSKYSDTMAGSQFDVGAVSAKSLQQLAPLLSGEFVAATGSLHKPTLGDSEKAALSAAEQEKVLEGRAGAVVEFKRLLGEALKKNPDALAQISASEMPDNRPFMGAATQKALDALFGQGKVADGKVVLNHTSGTSWQVGRDVTIALIEELNK